MGAILLVMAVIIFLVTLVMIRYMIRNLLLRDKKTIAIYKSMGYTEGEIKGIYVTFYQFIAVVGSILGVKKTKVRRSGKTSFSPFAMALRMIERVMIKLWLM